MNCVIHTGENTMRKLAWHLRLFISDITELWVPWKYEAREYISRIVEYLVALNVFLCPPPPPSEEVGLHCFEHVDLSISWSVLRQTLSEQ